MKKYFLILLLAFLSASSFAQAPAIEWQKSFGGSATDYAKVIRQTFDGGYIVAGLSNSFDGDVTGNHGSYDFWIVKVSASGILQWQKSLGGLNYEVANSIQQTFDSGYIIAGSSNSNDGDVTGNHGSYDYWVVKLSVTGSIQWQKSFGGTGNDVANSVQQTADSGYIVAGYTNSNDGDVTGYHGNQDCWIVKLSNTGSLQWQRSLGGTSPDAAYSIQQTSDGGFIVAGFSASNDGDVSVNHGNQDFWVVKLSTLGGIQWQKSLGGTGFDVAAFIQQTLEGGYIVAGYSNSNDGDVTGNHGGYDYWVIKLSATGIVQWQKSLGGSGFEEAYTFLQTSDSAYVIAGYSSSSDGDVTLNQGQDDYWLVKLSPAGNMVWQKSMGGSGTDMAYSIEQATDGSYIISGASYSTDGDCTGNHGGCDYWIVKLKSQVSVNPVNNNSSISIIPNPTTGNISIKGAGLVNVKVCNTLGQLIKEGFQTDHISLADFPAGMYFVRLFNEAGEMVYVDKVIKQ
jgi:Secretion system C-terminal sorting domain